MHQIQEEIGIPKIQTSKKSGQHMVFTVGPLPSGYGMTLGNAFRRVLLSSLPGAAVTGIKVEGVNYEYSTLKGVKDSVLDMTLNLKKLAIKKTGKDPVWMTLKASKPGVVTAKDIDTPSDVEILNPDLYITTIDKGGKLSMDIRVEKGVGYRPISEMSKEDDPDIILVDAFFSPVKKVRYDVEATRVGSLTNLDKLLMEIETNNSIQPDDALKFASNVLKSYFSLFNMEEVAIEAEFMSDVASIKQKEREEKGAAPQQESYTPIEILGLSPRTLNALINGDIGSIEQLVKCSESKLTNLRGFGKKALTEVKAALEARGLKFIEEE